MTGQGEGKEGGEGGEEGAREKRTKSNTGMRLVSLLRRALRCSVSLSLARHTLPARYHYFRLLDDESPPVRDHYCELRDGRRLTETILGLCPPSHSAKSRSSPPLTQFFSCSDARLRRRDRVSGRLAGRGGGGGVRKDKRIIF